MKNFPDHANVLERQPHTINGYVLRTYPGCDHFTPSDGLSFDNTIPGALTSATSSVLSVNLSCLAEMTAEDDKADGPLVDELWFESNACEPAATHS